MHIYIHIPGDPKKVTHNATWIFMTISCKAKTNTDICRLCSVLNLDSQVLSNTFSWMKKNWISKTISLKFVSKGLINNIPALVQIMAWHQQGGKPLSEPTRTTRKPAFWGYPPPPHDYPYHWVILDPKSKEDKVKVTNLKNSPKFQIFEFWNGHYTRHTFLSCLIRCANMKWIRWVFLKIQSGHDSVHRRTDGQTDGQTDGRTRWYQYTPLSTSLKRGV